MFLLICQLYFEPEKRPAGAFWADQNFELEKRPAGAFWADKIRRPIGVY